MAPQYGEVRVDYITYTTGVSPNEANVTVLVSGLVNNPTFSGNVIIEGNTTIDGDLTVSGSINASGVIISGITGLFDDGTEALPSIAFASDPDTGIYKPATNEIGISTNASEALRIDNNGNVGIGTTDPQARLDVESISDTPSLTFNNSGQAIIGDSATQLAIGRVTTSPFSVYLQARASNNAARNIALAPLGGNVGVGTSSPTSLLHLAANAPYITFEDIDNNQDWQLQATAWFALRNQTTASELVRVTADGKVGIGTTLPGAKLDILSASFSDGLTVTVGSGIAKIKQSSSSLAATLELLRDGVATSSNNAIEIGGNNGTFSSIAYDGTAFFSGNVGIGTTSPTGKLQIQPANSDIPASALVIRQNNGADTAQNTFSVEIDPVNNVSRLISSSTSSPQMSFYTSGNERIRIDQSGNVGIGITTPAKALHVFSSNEVIAGLFESSNTSAYVTFIDSATTNSNQVRIGSAGNEMRLFTGGTDSVRIDSTGNVGIGTTTPQAKLDVRVGGTSGYGRIKLAANSTVSATIEAIRSATDNSSVLAFEATTDDGNCFNINYSGGAYFKGDVGIGTTSPAYQLDVNTDKTEALKLAVLTGNTSTPAEVLMQGTNSTGSSSAQTKLISFSSGSGSNTGFGINVRDSTDAFGSPGRVVTVLGTGRVGIMKEAPTNELHVYGEGEATTGTVSPSEFTSSIQTDTAYLNIGRVGNYPSIQGSGGGTAYHFQLNPLQGNIGIGLGTTAPSDKLEVNGNLRFTSAGQGIKFAGHAAGNLLDDYEEGTWTPTVIGQTTAGTVTYATRQGYYTKIGNQVTIQLYVVWNSGTGGAGALRVSGLPFTSAANTTNSFVGAVMSAITTVPTNATVYANVTTNSSEVQINNYVAPGSASTTPWSASGAFGVIISYFVS
jgi:hypothetical protein